MKSKHLDELKEIAREATFNALKQYYEIPVELREQLVLGIMFDGDYRIFELYVPAERPEDAVVFTRAWVHVKTGDVLRVDILNLQPRNTERT